MNIFKLSEESFEYEYFELDNTGVNTDCSSSS